MSRGLVVMRVGEGSTSDVLSWLECMYHQSTQKSVASKIEHPAAFNFWCFYKSLKDVYS